MLSIHKDHGEQILSPTTKPSSSRTILKEIPIPSVNIKSNTHNKRQVNNMSAPNAGRQSPDPESQGKQQMASTAGNPNEQGAAPSMEHAKEASKDQLSGLSSNPEHPLAKASEEKTSKTQDPKA